LQPLTAACKKGLASPAAKTRRGPFPGCQKKPFDDKALPAACPAEVRNGRFLPVKAPDGASKAARPID
jgi:hypothetical protein